jgi:hypothetical protein
VTGRGRRTGKKDLFRPHRDLETLVDECRELP